jgi:hypothetical protein
MKENQTTKENENEELAQFNARVPVKIKKSARLVSVLLNINQEQLAADALMLLFGCRSAELRRRQREYITAARLANGGTSPFKEPWPPLKAMSCVA